MFFSSTRASSTNCSSPLAKTPTTTTSTNQTAKVTFDFSNPRRPSHDSGGGLHRIKKPQPLTSLPAAEDLLPFPSHHQLKPKTPRTPLIPSPDLLAVEERVSSGQTDLDKLRNLSVSSADFNFGEGGSSLPGTPSFRPQFFHIPGRKRTFFLIPKNYVNVVFFCRVVFRVAELT